MRKVDARMPRTIPCRIHVLLAAASPYAVVIRRGPSRHTAVIGWDRKTDTFTMGQWLYGRIYERRSDLSPDGRHLIYFAMNGRWSSSVKGSWTAISRAPYLKAVSLFAKGDCWHGGGLFQSPTRYWLNGGCGHETLEEDRRLLRVSDYPWHESYGGECPGVYYIRLQRDGWTMKHTAPDGQGGEVTLFEKRVNGHWRLRKQAHATLHHPVGRGVYYDTHALHNARTGETLVKEDWEWAEVDRGRLVWGAQGKISAGRLEASGLQGERVLFDCYPLRSSMVAAPY